MAVKRQFVGVVRNSNRLAQMRIGRLARRDKIANLSLAPTKLLCRDRAAKEFINEPDAVCVQDIAFAIQGHFFNLPSENHFLDTTAVNAFRFPRQPQYLADFVQLYFRSGT